MWSPVGLPVVGRESSKRHRKECRWTTCFPTDFMIIFRLENARWRNLTARMFPERPAPAAPVFSGFSVPHQFNPSLGFLGGLVALAAALARILAFCMVFVVWGMLTLLAWSRIASHFWRVLALVPMLLLLPAALIPPMLAIATIERRIWPRR